MERVNEDIKQALQMVKRSFEEDYSFSTYTTPFLFGTENQEGINEVINYNNKDVLTIASSGDHYLGAVYYGAKTVDLFDINRLTYYITYLKIAAITVLTYQEFLDFFIPVDNWSIRSSFWDYKVLKKLLPVLPSDVALFWDKILFKVKKNNYGQFLLLKMSVNHLDIVKRGMPFYSSEEEYYKLQKILRSRKYPTFFEVNLIKLSEVVVDEYDIVYLSNIIENLVMEELSMYPDFMLPFNVEDKIEADVLEKIGPHIFKCIRKEGLIMMDYRANRNFKSSSDLLFCNDFFDTTEISSKVPSHLTGKPDPDDVDLVLTYKPSKTGFYLQKR